MGKSPGNHKQECKSAGHVASSTAAVVACSTNNGEKRRTASDDSCGGVRTGYKATGHAREKPHLPICACEIGELEIIIGASLSEPHIDGIQLGDFGMTITRAPGLVARSM